MPETLLPALTDIRQRLKNNEYHNEEHVRFSLVGRVLLALGWNIWNPVEVYTEEKPHEGENHTKVDISLSTKKGKNEATVFLECKRVGKLLPQLEKVEQQVLQYNSKNGSSLIVLTDGRHWRLYYPLAQGHFKDRLFATYDLLEDDPGQTAQAWAVVLGRENVATGQAKASAETLWERRKQVKVMSELKEKAKVSAHDNFRSWQQELAHLMQQQGYAVSEAEAFAFIKTNQLAGPDAGSLPPATKAPRAPKPTPAAPPAALVADAGPVAMMPRFTFGLKGVKATGELLPDGQMRVLAGSTASGSITPSLPISRRGLRETLLASKKLVARGDHLLFKENAIFKSHRVAADILYGSPVNALVAWKHEMTGDTLGNFLAANQSKE